VVETSQKELDRQYEIPDNGQDEDEELEEESTQRVTTANIPIVRGNTPRLHAYNTMSVMRHKDTTEDIEDTEDEDDHYDTMSIPPFPSNPPSAPPVPEEQTTFDVIEKSRFPQTIQPQQEEQVEQMEQIVPEERRVRKKRIEREMLTPSIPTASVSLETASPPALLNNASPRSSRLVGFAIYLLCLLLLVLVLAVVQGMGVIGNVLMPDVVLLGVPWMVLVYGLLAGCVSCLVTLGRFQHINPPVFVLITWYARPFAAAVLALFAYLMLNSGLLLTEGGMARHQGLALVVGAVAGLCEGWLFLRRSERV